MAHASIRLRQPSEVGVAKNRVWPLAAAFAGSYALALPAVIEQGPVAVRIIFTGVGVTIAAGASALYYLKTSGVRAQDWWLQPSSLALVVAGLSFGVTPLAWLNPGLDSRAMFTREDVVAAQLGALVGVWAIAIGLGWGRRRNSERPVTRFVSLEPRFPSAHMVAFAVGLAATAGLVSIERFSYLGDPRLAFASRSSLPQILGILSALALYGSIMTLWLGLRSGSRRQFVIGCLMGVVVIIVGFLGGSKEPVVVPLVALLAVVRLARGRLPKSLLVGALVGITLLFVFSPLHRSNLRTENLPARPAIEEAAASLQRSLVEGPMDTIGEGWLAIYNRLRNVDSAAVIVARTPDEIPYRSLGSLPLEVGSALVPRFLWPEKPPVTDGYFFAIEYFDQEPATFSSTAVTLFGDLYRHGGLWVALVGGALLGWYLSILDRRANPLVYPGALFLFVAIVIPLAKAESGVAVTVAGQVQQGLVTLAFMYLLLASNTRNLPNEHSSPVTPRIHGE